VVGLQHDDEEVDQVEGTIGVRSVRVEDLGDNFFHPGARILVLAAGPGVRSLA
jgi:hypothetical protein